MGNKLVLNNTNVIDDNNITGLSKNTALNALFSIIRFSVMIIEEIVLLVFASIYFLIGAVVVSMYMLLYEQLYLNLLNKGGKKKFRSAYDFRWKNHHLNLNLNE